MSTADTASTDTLNADFSRATGELAVHDKRGNPRVDPENKSAAVTIAARIGERDGTNPGLEVHQSPVTLPSEQVMLTAMGNVLGKVGQMIDQTGSKVAMNVDLISPAEDKPRGWAAVRRFVVKNARTILLLAIIAVIEYMVGISYTQRAFDLSDQAASILALALPFVFALAGIFIAHVVAYTRPGRAKSIMLILAAVLAALLTTFVVLAGLVISETVKASGGGGGVSGGGSASEAASQDLTFALVKMAAYISLMLGIGVLVTIVHLFDLVVDEDRRQAALEETLAKRQSKRQVLEGHISYLQQFLDFYQALLGTRREIIASYIQGVRSRLSTVLATGWDSQRLLADPVEPGWVEDLKVTLSQLQAELDAIPASPGAA